MKRSFHEIDQSRKEKMIDEKEQSKREQSRKEQMKELFSIADKRNATNDVPKRPAQVKPSANSPKPSEPQDNYLCVGDCCSFL